MSCSDVQTIKAGDGSKLTFSFDFPYIFKSEIHVYFWNATTKEYDEKLTTDSTYPWRITDANPTIVEFTGTAPPAPSAPTDPNEPTVDNVKIRRITKVDDIRALFNPGSAIRSDDLNKNFEQLRYAIQESNCQGIPDDVDQYLKDYYWDRYDNTLYNGDTWVSDDTKIATTAALDARFQDEVNDTFTKAELAAASNIMPDDDVAVPTTGALDNYINEVITNDIGSSDGVTITDDGDGTITVGLADNSVDFDKIKDADQIQLADQIADPDAEGTDNNIFTAKAATRRFNNYYQNEAPTATDGIGEGQVWVDPNDDLTLSVWSGNAWVGITSGGTFTNQPKVVYVDASSGDDANDGHRISRPKQSIKAAVTQINADDTHGNGSIVVVAPGVYQEACPIQIQKRDVAIVGTSVRNCVVHPTPATETATMFEVNSGTYLKNLTFTGMKASGTRGDTGSLWENATYGLPPTQGWNVAFYDDAMIYKSPYVQNCTNFSDSEIDNSDLDFYAGDENKGRAGDLDSAPTGGGLLVDGSTPHADSPLRSIVCDSYTHTGLDAPGIFVTNNGYMQATSSYAFFNHAHITCINGGQANLAASTTDFGRYGLIASGKSTSAIFTSTIDGAVSDGAISFNIDAPTAASGWHGSATRPQGNMLVTVNSVTYPILSATANGSGWTVTISRPNSSNRSQNLGVNGAISDGAAVSFFLRSMIASSGHTMEYVGSGTDYRALPGNGGVPVDANQKVELDNGKIWTATTDQNGKFTVGGNQTDDPFFEVDQQLGFVTIPEGSIAFNLVSDLTPQLGGNLDVNGNEITSASNGDVTISPNGTGDIVLDANVGIGDSSPSGGKLIVRSTLDSSNKQLVLEDATNGWQRKIGVDSSNNMAFYDGNNERMRIDSSGNVGIGTSSAGSKLHVSDNTAPPLEITRDQAVGGSGILLRQPNTTDGNDLRISYQSDTTGTGAASNVEFAAIEFTAATHNNSTRAGEIGFYTAKGGEGFIQRMRIDSSGNVGIGETNPVSKLVIKNTSSNDGIRVISSTTGEGFVLFGDTDDSNTGGIIYSHTNDALEFNVNNSERMRIDSSGRLLVGATSAAIGSKMDVHAGSDGANIFGVTGADQSSEFLALGVTSSEAILTAGNASSNGTSLVFRTANSSGAESERLRIDSSGNVGVGSSDPADKLEVAGDIRLKPASGANTLINFEYNNGLFAQIRGNGRSGSPLFGDLEFWTKGSGDSAPLERMVVDADGRVGIGTSSPLRALTIAKTGSIISGTGNSFGFSINPLSNGYVYLDAITGGSANTSLSLRTYNNGTYTQAIQSISGNETTFETAGTERMRIDNSGNVGIGNSSPSRKLHIHDGSGSSAQIVKIDSGGVGLLTIQSGTSSESRIEFGDSSNDDAGYIYYDNNGDVMKFGVNASERMRINNSGQVGIGTTSPSSLLSLGTSLSTFKLKLYDAGDANDYGFGSQAGTLDYHSGGSHNFYKSGSEKLRITSTGQLQSHSEGNTTLKPMQGCRAFCCFKGTGTVSIHSSFNVSALTDLAAGHYEISFSVGMIDANYGVTTGFQRNAANDEFVNVGYDNTTARLRAEFFDSGTRTDCQKITVAVFR